MMAKAELNTTLIDSYFELFRRLSAKGKEELISKLNKSLKRELPNSPVNTDSFFATFGAFQSDKSADEIIGELTKSRNFNRNIEEL